MNSILRSVSTIFLDLTETVVITLSVWLIVYLFVATPTQVQGSSMEPNFTHDDCVITEKLSYRFSPPSRGDVVVVQAPPAANCQMETGCDFFKRIIGLPTETIAVQNCHFVINGNPLQEDYLPESTCTRPGSMLNNSAITLQADEYFVAGDNREHSSDSRVWGPVPSQNIQGKAVFRWCPRENLGRIGG